MERATARTIANGLLRQALRVCAGLPNFENILTPAAYENFIEQIMMSDWSLEGQIGAGDFPKKTPAPEIPICRATLTESLIYTLRYVEENQTGIIFGYQDERLAIHVLEEANQARSDSHEWKIQKSAIRQRAIDLEKSDTLPQFSPADWRPTTVIKPTVSIG